MPHAHHFHHSGIHHHHHHHINIHPQHHHRHHPSYVGYGNRYYSRPGYGHYRNSGSQGNSRFVMSGVLAMIFSIPVIIFGALFVSGIISSGMKFAGIALLAIGGIVFTVGIVVLIVSCCICSDPRVVPTQMPGSHPVGVMSPDQGMGHFLQPAQPVLPPPYMPKSASPPPYTWSGPTPVGDVEMRTDVQGPYSIRRGPNTASNQLPNAGIGMATPRAVQVIDVQSRASPSFRSNSPPPRAQLPDRSKRPNGPDTHPANANPRAHRPRSPTNRLSMPNPGTSYTTRPSSPARNYPSSSPSPPRSYGAGSPDSHASSSLPSVLRPNSSETRSTPPPSSALRLLSPVNRSSPAPSNPSRQPPSNRRLPNKP